MSSSLHCLFFSILIINSYASRCDKYSLNFNSSEIVGIVCGSQQQIHFTQDDRLNVKLLKFMCESKSSFSLDTAIFKIYPNTTVVDMSCSNINSIQSFFCESRGVNVVTLDASFNGISVLFSDELHCLPNLREINLSNNKISFLGGEIFSKFKHLEIMDLSYNNIDHFNAFTIQKSSSLKIMNLKCNPLRIIDSRIFAHFPTTSIIVHISMSMKKFPNCIRMMGSTCTSINSNAIM